MKNSYEKKFLNFLTEEDDMSSLTASREDDINAMKNSLDDPENLDNFKPSNPEKRIEDEANYSKDIKELKDWIEKISEVIHFFNGPKGSVLAKLTDEQKPGTVFEDIPDSLKNKILDIVEKLGSMREGLRHYYMEKYK